MTLYFKSLTMNIRLFFIVVIAVFSLSAQAQMPTSAVPLVVRSELARRYPDAKNAAWQKSNGNYEASFTSKAEGRATAVFTTFGAFVSILTPVQIQFLPVQIGGYVKDHFHSSVMSAQKNVSVVGKITYRIKIKNGKTLIFDQDGKCLSR